MIRLIGGHATDAGRVRSNNQDRVVVAEGTIYGVADGMGGHRGGEVAAQMISEGLGRFAELHATTANGPTLTTSLITKEITNLNNELLERAGADDDLFGMGTTLTGMALAKSENATGEDVVLSVFNIGDSRTYLLRNGELQQLTEDHSVVADLLRAGRISAEEAKTHRQRSVVTRALGVEATIDVDVLEILPAPGTRYLMCSDGLTNEVGDELIGSILRRLASPAEASRELVRLAVERGGRDNVTVVVVDVVDDAGYDRAALGASWDIESSPPDSTAVTSTEPATSAHRNAANTPNAKTSYSQATNATPAPKPVKVRKPFPINLRVIAFLAVLALLGGITFAVIKAAPDVEGPNLVVDTSQSVTSLVDTSIPQESVPSASEELNVAPTVPAVVEATEAATSTTFDGFTETTVTTAEPTTTKKKKR